jgi:hypothetical protein
MKFIQELGSTNFRIFVTTCCFAATVLTLLIGIILGKNLEPYQWLITTIFGAEALFSGLDVAQFWGKRTTDANYMAQKVQQQQPAVNVQTANVQAGDVSVQAPPIDPSTSRANVGPSVATLEPDD